MLHMLLLAAATPPTFENLQILDERIAAQGFGALPIDKRLKLAKCPDAPDIAPPAGGAVIVRCPALGWRLRVAVDTAPSAASSNAVVIRKGEIVEAVTGGPGFSVSTSMVALEDGAAGQAIRVKSPTSSGPLTATVKARGTVSF